MNSFSPLPFGHMYKYVYVNKYQRHTTTTTAISHQSFCSFVVYFLSVPYTIPQRCVWCVCACARVCFVCKYVLHEYLMWHKVIFKLADWMRIHWRKRKKIPTKICRCDVAHALQPHDGVTFFFSFSSSRVIYLGVVFFSLFHLNCPVWKRKKN